MQKPKVKSSKLLHDGYIALREDLLEKEGGILQPINTLVCTDAVAMLAKDEEGRWIINREYRHATGEVLLGCPGGKLERGEDPLVGGKREFFEETGYWADEVFLAGSCYPFPGLCNQKIYYLYAPKAKKIGTPKLDAFEFIESELIENGDLRRRIAAGALADGILLTAIWFADHFSIC